MVRWLFKLLFNAGVFLGVSHFLPGFHVRDFQSAVLAALAFGFVNSIVKPVVQLLSLPITLLTLGLFLLVINAGVLALAAFLVPGFSVDGFRPALLGWACVSVGSAVVAWLFKKDD